MIFFDGSSSSLKGISDTIDDFQLLSGLGMNREKTALFYTGLNPEEAQNMAHYDFHLGTLPIRYLGLPLLHMKLKKSDYSPLLDKITARFNSWTVKYLSFAGRLQLISSVIYSLVNFWLSAFALPKGCLKDIQRLCSRFLWAGNLNKKSGAKVSWTKVCLPKSEGGLGLRNLLIWNRALNLRLLWLLLASSGSLWVAWNKEHRLKHSNLWATEVQNNSSWIWKYILSLRPLAKALIGCEIGDGKTASFWYDNWTGHGPLIEFVGSLGPQKLGVPALALVAHAKGPEGWKLPSIRTRTPTLQALRETLQNMTPPHDDRGADRYSWGPVTNRSTTFSTKKAWDHIRPSAPKGIWAKVVWFKSAIPKHAFTFWTAHLDKLPVRSRLLNWGMNISSSCCLCTQHLETRDHLFLHCEFSEELWKLVLHRLGQTRFLFMNWQSMITWLSSTSPGNSSKLKLLVIHATVFLIWKERNNRLFNNSTIPPIAVFGQLDRTVRDSLLARRSRKGCARLLSQWFARS